MSDTPTYHNRICKRCLTRDMIGENEFFANLQEQIASLDPAVRSDDVRYEERLSVCRECELLFQGMCRVCGCYVELRAAIDRNSCPNHRW